MVILVLAAWACWAGLELFQAARDGRAGVQLARRAVDAAAAGELTDPKPLADLRRAQSNLGRARSSLHSLPLKPAVALPVLGRQLRELQALSDGAVQVADISVDTLQASQAVLGRERRTGPQRVAALRALGETAREGSRRAATIRRTSGEHLLATVREEHDEFGRELERLRSTLDRAGTGASATADLLDGPRRYLVLAANNAEMRAGSGMFLSVGGFTTEAGRLTYLPFTPSHELLLPPPGVPIPVDFSDRWGWLSPGQEWRNLNLSPRFDQSAPLAAAMWEAQGNGPVDGVIAVDPIFLRAVLEGVGPVEVAGGQVNSSNVVSRILHDQYVDHAQDPDQGARREELGLIAEAVFAALESRSWDPVRLGRALAQAAQDRHVLAWSSRADEQRAWVVAGIDGALSADSLLLGVQNRGGNKLDQFLELDASLDVTPGVDRSLGLLTVRLRNRVPLDEPSYVAGPNLGSGVGEGVYLGLLTVNLPGEARQARIVGIEQLAVAGGDGPTRVVGAEVQLARGEERTYVVQFELPAGPGSLRVEATARVPAVQWSAQANALRWNTSSRRVTW